MNIKTILILICMAMPWQVLAQQKININLDDVIKPINQRRVAVVETREVSVYSGSIEDLENNIAMMDIEIVNLQARRAELVKLKDSISTAINR